MRRLLASVLLPMAVAAQAQVPPPPKLEPLPEGPGGWLRRDSLDDGTRVPMWPLHTFD